MLKIVVTDLSADSRSRIVEDITRLLQSDVKDAELLPRIDLKPLSRQELKFHAAPDICIIGEGLVTQDMSEVGKIRKLLPDTGLIVRVDSNVDSLAFVEQLARLGADDVIPVNVSSSEFLRKVIVLARKAKKAKAGKLILVDAGKGGLGVTSLTAALAETLVSHGKKVLAVDFDTDTQDLSRFLRTRPFINENLQLLFSGSRPLTQEFIEQCLLQVWNEEANFFCMPPVTESDDFYDPRNNYSRTLISVLEVLDSLFDCVIVDSGSAKGLMLKTLYRAADKLVFVVNNDPASLYASVDRINKARSVMSVNAEILLLDNMNSKTGLDRNFLMEELNRAAKLSDASWLSQSFPFCKVAQKWPASGSTLFSQGTTPLRAALLELGQKLEMLELAKSETVLSGIFKNISLRRKSSSSLQIETKTETQLPITSEQPLELPEPVKLVTFEPALSTAQNNQSNALIGNDTQPQKSKEINIDDELDAESLVSQVVIN